MLIRAYPTPQILRHKATQLGAARRDATANRMVEVMRAVADYMNDE
jgi:hypothetical protein